MLVLKVGFQGMREVGFVRIRVESVGQFVVQRLLYGQSRVTEGVVRFL